MPQLSIKFELAEVDARTRKPLPGVVHEVEVDAPELDARDLDGSLRANLPDLDRQARNAVAARGVDYDAFEGDSEYLEAVEKAASVYYTVSVSVEGASVRKYVAEGIYPENGGLWSDEAHGVNASEAEFQAAWMMAENADGAIESRIDAKTTPEQSIESQLASMEDQRVVSVDVARPSRWEAFAALEKLCTAIRTSGDEAKALADAELLLAADKAADAASGRDGIQYLEGDAASSAPAP